MISSGVLKLRVFSFSYSIQKALYGEVKNTALLRAPPFVIVHIQKQNATKAIKILNEIFFLLVIAIILIIHIMH